MMMYGLNPAETSFKSALLADARHRWMSVVYGEEKDG